MGAQSSDFVTEIKAITADIAARDTRADARIDKLTAEVNALILKVGRPGAGGDLTTDDEIAERKSAADLCIIRRHLTVPKDDGSAEYVPTTAEIDDALAARRAFHGLFRHGDPSRLDPTEKKSLTSFALGSSGFLTPPEISNTVLSCLVDPTDLTGIVASATTSSASLKFPIDNLRTGDAAWACEASCFANNPSPDLQEGLGELEVRAESLRYVVCAGSDLIQDAAFPIENWVMRKVSDGFRRSISQAIISGTGNGMPLGILHPLSGVPICETSPNTPAGMFTWQDLVSLKWSVPVQYHAQGGAYLLNQRTFALLLTMSDAIGRPLLLSNPTEAGQFLLNGSPVVIASQMPDVAPGATPIAFGGWRAAYMLVWRKATSMLTDPYSAGWCILYKFEARVGGNTICPNAAALLRIR